MIQLSKDLSKKVNVILGKETDNEFFLESDLNNVKKISLSKLDFAFIEYFKNVEELTLESFPSIVNDDILFISQHMKAIKNLTLKEQNAIFNLDLSYIPNLEELSLIHNDNLVNIYGLNKLSKFVFYDNKDFNDIRQIVDFIINNKDSHIILDVMYYIDILKIFYDENIDLHMLDNLNWVESVGLRKFYVYEYNNKELKEMLKQISYIVSKYIYTTDGDIEKFVVLYEWIINNIKFVNEDDPQGEDINQIINVNRVFDNRKGGRLSLAKAFQMLLSFAGIKSSIVYSLGAFDTIGFYNGKKIYSLLGESDYAVLRVRLDDREYYCDITWDSLINHNDFFDKLRLFLFSKDELRIRHKFVGEGNIEKTFSYHGDDCDDMLDFAKARIKEVDDTFQAIDNINSIIDGMELNVSALKKQIKILENKINNVDINSDEYKELLSEIINCEEDIRQDEETLMQVRMSKKNKFKEFVTVLKNRYVYNKNALVDDILNELERKNKVQFLSDYMYELLKFCLI